MTKEEALKQFANLGAVWFGNSKQHFAFSAYCRLQGWNKLADKWKEEAEEEWDEAEEVLQRLVELGCKPADLQERSEERRVGKECVHGSFVVDFDIDDSAFGNIVNVPVLFEKSG